MAPFRLLLLPSVLRVLVRVLALHMLQPIGAGSVRFRAEEAGEAHAHVDGHVHTQRSGGLKFPSANQTRVLLSGMVTLRVTLQPCDHLLAHRTLFHHVRFRLMRLLFVRRHVRVEHLADVALAPLRSNVVTLHMPL